MHGMPRQQQLLLATSPLCRVKDLHLEASPSLPQHCSVAALCLSELVMGLCIATKIYHYCMHFPFMPVVQLFGATYTLIPRLTNACEDIPTHCSKSTGVSADHHQRKQR